MMLAKLLSPHKVINKIKRTAYVIKARRIYRKEACPYKYAALSVNNKSMMLINKDELDTIGSYLLLQDDQSVKNDILFANRILERKIHLLGHFFDFSNGRIIWEHDPVTQRRWDNGFSFDILYTGPERLSDIKLPWELAKMQYLFILGKTYAYTHDRKYASEMIGQITSWIDGNPPFKGIHWISALEVGMRVCTFIMIYPFIKDHIEPPVLQNYLNSIYIQTEFVEDNLQGPEYANNHLIGEAVTLVLGGLFLNSPKSRRFYEKGVRILSEQIEKQFFSDGVSKEQSLNYHRFVLDYYYLFIIILRKNAIAYPKIIDEYTEKMTEFIMYSLTPDGLAPSFGDADDDRAIYVKSGCHNDYKAQLALGAALFHRADFKYAAGPLPEEILWLMGSEGMEQFNKLQASPPTKKSKNYPDGGYFIMRDKWDKDAQYLIFDCGPLGYKSAGHGHADALSFQLCSGGINYFVDPGTYSYNLDYEWRDYFRSTPAHNTVTVDGFNQSEIRDRMSWKTFANAKCNRWLSTEWFDLVDGEHDGYRRLKDPVLHRRIIFFDKSGYWIIIDLLSCRGEHTFDYHLHLHPDCLTAVDYEHNSIEVAAKNGKRINVNFIQEDYNDLKYELFKGDEKTRLGWFSESYGVKLPAYTIRVRKKNRGNTMLISLISTSKKKVSLKSSSPVLLTISDQGEKTEDTLFYPSFTQMTLEDETFSFNGSFLFMKKRHGELLYLCANDFDKLMIKGDLDLHSKSIIKNLTLEKRNCHINIDRDKIAGLRMSGADFNNIKVNGEGYRIKDGLLFPENAV